MEDYKEKYEMALEGVQEILSSGQDSIKMSQLALRLHGIFPELAESEDEKIRKALVRFHKSTIDIDGIKGADIVAWLEKQGQTFTKKDVDDAYLKGVFDAKHELEKNGEQKHINDTDEEIVNAVKDTSVLDMVEPKFKVGDWIVNNDSGGVHQVKEIRDNEYCLWPLYAEIQGYLRIIDVDTDYHLWTIQDAKDGDVLIDEDVNVIGIFEGIEGMCWHSKLYYSSFTKELYGIECGGSHRKEFAKPATKEQRELLFKKMKEAGYEWNADKKKLEKVEQKQEWSEEDEKMYRMCIDAVEYYHTPEDESAIREWLKSLKDKIRKK